MIVGTAGHIDHGKSTLVTALTGRRTDRLAEERRRGITIELGFVRYDLPDGGAIAFIDVPGHEQFVRTMVAGASGLDAALLVIAADEGIMPQTAEHLLVLEQLGVPRGLPVVTKADLVDPEWLALMLDDVAGRLAASPVRFDPPVAVAAARGTGLDAVHAWLHDAARHVRPRARDDRLRVPLDRAFSVPGVGTVIAGTVWSGVIRVGDALRLLPSGAEARVRSLERLGEPVDEAAAGDRVALAVPGLPLAAARRGEVVTHAADAWEPSRLLDVELALDAGAAKPLRDGARVRVHVGTAEVLARLRLPRPLEPGSAGIARLGLEHPVVARGGDRFVLRSYSPPRTIGGGVVLDPLPPRRSRAATAPSPAEDAAVRLGRILDRREHGIALETLPQLLGLSPPAAGALVAGTGGLRLIEEHVVRASVVAGLRERLREAVRARHREAPAEPGLPLEQLRQLARAPAWLAEAALAELLASGALVRQGSVVHARGFTPRGGVDATALEQLVARVRTAGLEAPTVAELERETGRRDVLVLLRAAEGRGDVVAVARDHFFAPEAVARFRGALLEVGRAGEIAPAALRDLLGVSRKYLIPLLEWADRQRLTVREGDARRLLPGQLPA